MEFALNTQTVPMIEGFLVLAAALLAFVKWA